MSGQSELSDGACIRSFFMKRMRKLVLVLVGLVMIGSSFQSLAAEQTMRDVSRANEEEMISP